MPRTCSDWTLLLNPSSGPYKSNNLPAASFAGYLKDAYSYAVRFADGRPRRMDVAFLKRKQVRAVNADGQEVKSWPLFRCLYAEIEHGESTYVLTNGKWSGIGERFLQRVNAEYNAIPGSIALVLPDCDDDCDAAPSLTKCAKSSIQIL